MPADDHHTTHDRIRAAIINSGLTWSPTPTTLTVVGHRLPELDTGIDLALALALLTATERIPTGYLDQAGILGELGLDGSIRPIRDPRSRVEALVQAGLSRLIVPADQSVPARYPGRSAPAPRYGQPAIWAATSLREIIERLQDAGAPTAPTPDLADMPDSRIRRMVEIAAAGGHHLSLTGCPNPGASQIGQVLTGLLPDLDDRVARQIGDLYWQAGKPRPQSVANRPPWIGVLPPLGAGTLVRPGPASLAHCGVLCPGDPSALTGEQIRVLRSVLDQRRILIRDRDDGRSWPARAQLVLATGDDRLPARLHPVVDRIDLHLNPLNPRESHHFTPSTGIGSSNALVVERITRARTAATRRWSPGQPLVNAEIEPDALRRTLHLLPGAYLRRQADTARLSTRGWVGVLRLAWTIADLAGHAHPSRTDVDEAIAWRTGGLGHR